MAQPIESDLTMIFIKKRSVDLTSIIQKLAFKRKTQYIFTLSSVLCFAIRGYSAGNENFSLQQAIDETFSQSLSLQKSESILRESEHRRQSAFQTFLPTLMGSVNYLPEKKYMLVDINMGGNPMSIQQVIPTTLYSLKASYPLFEGGAGIQNLKASDAFLESARQDAEWQKFQLKRQVTQTYFQLVGQKALLAVSEQNKKALEDHLKDIKAFKSVGASTHYDVLRVETQLSLAQSELLNTIDNLEIAKMKLGELMGKEAESRTPTDNLPHLTAQILNEKQIQEFSIEQRGDIKSLSKKLEATESLATSSSKYWIPRVSLIGEYNYYNNINERFADSSAFRDSYFAGVNLTWNIFDGMSSISRSGIQSEQQVQMQKTFSMSQIKAKQDIEMWKRKFLYFCNVTLARENDIQRSEEAVRLAKAGQKAGVRTSTEFLDAEVDLFRSKAALVYAQLGAIEALTQIELATGLTLFKY